MKYVILAICACFFCLELIFPVEAINAPNINEIEMMLKNIENNMRVASQVVSVAQSKSAELVEQKAQEKVALQDAVVNAEAKTEMFAAKMISAGLDTSTIDLPAQMKGPAYDAFLNYVEEGGQEDFEYFRLYLWQQK